MMIDKVGLYQNLRNPTATHFDLYRHPDFWRALAQLERIPKNGGNRLTMLAICMKTTDCTRQPKILANCAGNREFTAKSYPKWKPKFLSSKTSGSVFPGPWKRPKLQVGLADLHTAIGNILWSMSAQQDWMWPLCPKDQWAVLHWEARW